MISPSAKAIRDNLHREVLDDTPLTVKRQQWETSAQQIPTPYGVNVNKVRIGGVACLQCEPDQLTSNGVIVYCHGGGLVEGSAETYRVWTSRLALHTGCCVISIDYRLAPEHPYPAAIDDVLSVCTSLKIENSSKVFSIGADSSGCILALLALLKLRGTNANYPSSAFLLSPSIDLTFSSASFQTNATKDLIVSLGVLRQYAKYYAGNRDLNDPDISPLLADIQGIAQTLVMVDDSEILLDDAKRLVDKITRAGGTARLVLSNGLWHVWPAWGDFPESTRALDDIKQHILAE